MDWDRDSPWHVILGEKREPDLQLKGSRYVAITGGRSICLSTGKRIIRIDRITRCGTPRYRPKSGRDQSLVKTEIGLLLTTLRLVKRVTAQGFFETLRAGRTICVGDNEGDKLQAYWEIRITRQRDDC